MAQRLDITGQRFGRLTAIRAVDNIAGRYIWLCACDCGGQARALVSKLRNGNTQSCGCLQRERASEANTTHSMTGTHVYTVWVNMLARCENKLNTEYRNYGGRGIRVCHRWRVFSNFLHDVGVPAQGLTLDRIDNEGDYEPSNCTWATGYEQGRNKRNNRWVTYNGETLILAEWARRLGIDAGTLRKRWIREGVIQL